MAGDGPESVHPLRAAPRFRNIAARNKVTSQMILLARVRLIQGWFVGIEVLCIHISRLGQNIDAGE